MAKADDFFVPDRDVADVLELRAAVWGAGHAHTDAAFFRWLGAGDDPAVPKGVLIRGADGQPFGFAALSIKPLSVGGRVLKLAHGVDYMIRPGARDMLASRQALRVATTWLGLARERGCSYGIVFPNDNSNRILTSKHIGFAPVFDPVLMVRPLLSARPRERLHAKLPVWAGAAALRVGALASTFVSAVRPRGRGRVRAVETFGPEFDRLWEEAGPGLGVATVRDSRHLNWRYRDHPVYRYRSLALEGAAGLDGYAVATRRSLMGVEALLVADLLVRDWSGPAVGRLVDGLLESAAADGADMLGVLVLTGGRPHGALRRHGFATVPGWAMPRRFHTAGIALDPEACAAIRPQDWHFTWGDTDVV